jgi:hypothetical protein
MEKKFNVNEFIFGRTKAEKKLEVLDNLSGSELRKATNETILRIFKECRGKDSDGKPYDKFYIKNDRRAGNCLGGSRFWNSTIEFIHEYRGKACIEFYVQNTKTDWGESVDYDRFKANTEFRGYSDYLNTYFRYDSTDIANVIRCILKEFVYYKYIERAERERREKVAALLHWKIYNPVCNQFYDEWRCKYDGGYPGAPHSRIDRYHRAEKAVKGYVQEHADELFGKSAEELQAIYRKIFRETD